MFSIGKLCFCTMPENLRFCDRYALKEELGKGAFSIVYRCVDTETNNEYAAKVIRKEKMSKRDLMKLESEARICRKLDHPNIVKLHRVFGESKFHYFLFDLVTGGELFDDLVTRVDNYTEELAAKCLYQMLDSVKHCHLMGVIHRDLKPENILLESKENKVIKLADFGLAVEALEGEYKWFGLAGTPNYMAPEVLEMKPYGRPVDLWACGVILYIMLGGYQPFYHTDERKLNTLIKSGDYELSSDIWRDVTVEGKDMIMKLLCVVPERRLTAAQAIEHVWFTAVVHSSLFLSSFLTMSKKKQQENAVDQRSSSTSVIGPSKKANRTGK
ncbi:calcium/calmodulin-dependent protein kinase type II subunit delta-like isoform X3 [Homalodisca vitripennis]|uniref:calcium/calmodulin-dependent protein kinase type II subunit delta-like isoform X3 n=1 Tax=Homalodisca vitripennis TaxID=197043 RepID=UPI001EEA64F6|nr:calcium/calmodulin-dependent protein kinase type II subunit delta-like isoform X3 [Homalodisca vitripennis]